MQYARFIAAFLVYAIIDIAWNLSPPARGMYENFYEASGHDALLDQFGRPLDELGGTVLLAALVFFLLIGLANSVLAIEPALRESSLLKAARNSFIFGCAAYATYVVPIYLMTKTWPGALGAHRHPHRRRAEPDNVVGHNLRDPAAPPSQRLK